MTEHVAVQMMVRSAEQTNGVRLLGTPIGNKKFITTFLQSSLTNIETFQQQADEYITDPHAKLVFFKQCIESKSAHLQLASILAHDTITQISNKTPFADKSDTIAQNCIANILQLNKTENLVVVVP